MHSARWTLAYSWLLLSNTQNSATARLHRQDPSRTYRAPPASAGGTHEQVLDGEAGVMVIARKTASFGDARRVGQLSSDATLPRRASRGNPRHCGSERSYGWTRGHPVSDAQESERVGRRRQVQGLCAPLDSRTGGGLRASGTSPTSRRWTIEPRTCGDARAPPGRISCPARRWERW